MKVYVAIPCLDTISARFVQCLTQLEKPCDVEIGFNVGTLVYHSRNTLAGRAIGSHADYTMWLDSDMTFMPDTLTMMLDALVGNRIDILTGLYYRRRPPWTPTLYKRLDITNMGISTEEVEDVPDGLFEVQGCGFGAVLMRTDILANVMTQYGPPFNPIGVVGEDLSFCWRARRLRNKIVCDPSLAFGHEVHTVITRHNRGMFTWE